MNVLVEFCFYLIIVQNNQITYQWLFYVTLSILLIYFGINTLKASKAKKMENSIQASDESDNYIFFNELEKTVISQIIEKTKSQEPFTVYELNILLGVKNKSIEIQKKIRTEAIIRINHKFNVNFNMDTVFIERIRSIEDRRYFNYFINEVNMKVYLKNI
jgi:hypothetical protein